MNTYGELVNVTGNENCWYRVKGSLLGLLYFIMNNYKQEPGQKMLRHWVVRDRCFGVKNISNSRIDTATVYCQTRNCIKDYARYCGVTKAINNAWCRKTYSTIQVRVLLCTLTLGELLMPEELVMAVTNHKSSKQMRRDYGTRDNALSTASAVDT